MNDEEIEAFFKDFEASYEESLTGVEASSKEMDLPEGRPIEPKSEAVGVQDIETPSAPSQYLRTVFISTIGPSSCS